MLFADAVFVIVILLREDNNSLRPILVAYVYINVDLNGVLTHTVFLLARKTQVLHFISNLVAGQKKRRKKKRKQKQKKKRSRLLSTLLSESCVNQEYLNIVNQFEQMLYYAFRQKTAVKSEDKSKSFESIYLR